MLLGCHLSCKDGYLKMAENAVSVGANTFQFFTRNPRGSHEKPLNADDLTAFKAYCHEHGIATFVGYAPYTVNPASAKMSERDFSQMILSEDLARMEETPGQLYTLHPGHRLEQSADVALAKAADMLNQVMHPSQTTTVLLANTGGEGTTMCSTFEELASLIGQVKLQEHIGVCFDVSSAWATGYDIVGDLDGVLDQLDAAIGLDKVREVHLNDSKEGCGSKVVRHVDIGQGTIGFDALLRVLEHPKLAGRPFIIEIANSSLPIYKAQIEAFKMGAKAR